MPQRVEFNGTIHEFPDGFTDADIQAALSSADARPYYGEPHPQPSHEPQPQLFGSLGIQTVSDAEWSAMSPQQRLQGVLKAAGYGIAGMLGMGQEGRGAVDHPVRTLGTAALGPVAGKAVSAVGKGAYKGAVALLPKTLKQQHPNIAETGFKEGIALTRRGAEKAGRLASESRQQADDMILAAEKAGAKPVSPMEVVRELRPVGSRMRAQEALGKPSDMPTLTQRAKAFRAQGDIPVTRAQMLKREAQDLADSAYKARDRGATFNQMEALTDEAQARGLRLALERRVPGVAGVNQRTQNLMGVQRGAEHAAETGHILSRLGGAGAGLLAGSGGGALPAVGAAAAGSLLTTPGGLSRLGLVLNRAGQGVPNATLLGYLVSLLDEPRQTEHADEHR